MFSNHRCMDELDVQNVNLGLCRHFTNLLVMVCLPVTISHRQ